jgi:hypothetical protein
MIEDGRLRPAVAVGNHPDGPRIYPPKQISPYPSLPPLNLPQALKQQKPAADGAEFTKRWSLNIFRQVEERLAEYAGHKLEQFPLVFLKTPTRKDPFNDDALILDESSPLNTLALDREKWLCHHRFLFQTFTREHQHDRRMSLQIAKITRKLEKQSELMARVKLLEWKRQDAAISKAGDCLVDSRGLFQLSAG